MNQIKSGSLPALRLACVFIPLTLALVCIASTSLPPSLQNQSLFGVPLMLCLWFLASLVICLLTVLIGLRLSFTDEPVADNANCHTSKNLTANAQAQQGE